MYVTLGELRVPAKASLVPLVASFASRGAAALGLDEKDSDALGIAAEEVFSHLAACAAPGRDVVLRLDDGGWRAGLEVRFAAEPGRVDFRPFNLTFRTTPEEDPLLARTALAIASRMVDRFQLRRQDREILLTLTRERRFPKGEPPPPEPRPEGAVSARAARPHEIPLAAGLAAARHPAGQVLPAFGSPGTVSAMAAAGDLDAVVAADAAGRLAGALFFRPEGDRLVELLGPFLFQEPAVEGAARLLVDACLAALGRAGRTGVLARNPTDAMPPNALEPLGPLDLRGADGVVRRVHARFRQLDEDPGGIAHLHPRLEPFVREALRRLAFARTFRLLEGPAVPPGEGTAFATEIDRRNGQAHLKPLWLGADARATLDGLLAALSAEGLANPTAELDLGEPWHAGFAPALLDAGFEPRLVVPWAATGDVLLLQRTTEPSAR
ncbi:MAG TPA: hypothetical protein P5164_01540 [Thermoanaerobaculia bacterium]|nr:hypothetical protein [Thermoanaerobaculia bacterium]